MVQNMTTCLYQTELGCVTVTWCRTLMGGQSLSFTVNPNPNGASNHEDDEEEEERASVSHRVQMKPWFFWKKKGSKKFYLLGRKARVFWDLSKAKFSSGPEPDRGFYLCLVSDRKSMALLVGDMRHEAYSRTRAQRPEIEAVLLSRREHVFGRRLYSARAKFGDGEPRGVTIEWEADDPGLCFRIDGKPVLKVRRLSWKFRGNDRFVVDGVPVQVFWDVHNWLFDPGYGHAVFMFQEERTGPSSASECAYPVPWPSGFGLNGPEKSLLKTGSFSSYSSSSSSACSSSVLEWANTESDPNANGFSLVVYAWRT
ncbi:uncharacterized protein LOC116250380 [Nymphaea colorata]|uniref:uncharacterized protein LOC116250380 n=1 Tax=Nymphaea colorata TaxID=210225 RepID=UPI00129E2C11|nr:uncharacterized protein LOC116250380 [Nymphaea colorata]